MSEWKVASNVFGDEVVYQVWRQTRDLQPGEPMHSGVREYQDESYDNKEDAQEKADELNAEGRNKDS